VAAREPIPLEDGARDTGPQVRGHAEAQEPAPGPKTHGGSGACPIGGKRRRSWLLSPRTCGGAGARPRSANTWRLKRPHHGKVETEKRHVAAQEAAPREGGDEKAGPRVRGHAEVLEPISGMETHGGSGAHPTGGGRPVINKKP
jgi:hypothetical protein